MTTQDGEKSVDWEQDTQEVDPDNPPITDFSHFTTADAYWRKKLAPWIRKQQKVVTNETDQNK